jgi:hypothetical protein
MVSCVSKLGNSTGVKLHHANLDRWDEAHEWNYQQILKRYAARNKTLEVKVCEQGDIPLKFRNRIKYGVAE